MRGCQSTIVWQKSYKFSPNTDTMPTNIQMWVVFASKNRRDWLSIEKADIPSHKSWDVSKWQATTRVATLWSPNFASETRCYPTWLRDLSCHLNISLTNRKKGSWSLEWRRKILNKLSPCNGFNDWKANLLFVWRRVAKLHTELYNSKVLRQNCEAALPHYIGPERQQSFWSSFKFTLLRNDLEKLTKPCKSIKMEDCITLKITVFQKKLFIQIDIIQWFLNKTNAFWAPNLVPMLKIWRS